MKKLLALASLVVLGGSLGFVLAGCGTGATHAGSSTTAWRRVPAAPFASPGAGLTSVWTGREMIVSGTQASPDGTFTKSVDVAAAYNSATRTWRRLASPPKTDNYCRRSAVWTGEEMLVWGCGFVAFNPLINRWRRLPLPPSGQGIVVWTGREMIGWGGGCCGDANSGGAAYRPAANTWRKLARSPLAASQQPIGAWTGRELVMFVSGLDPDGNPIRGAARAAAYNPTTDTWRRIAPLPEPGGTAVWDGRELLVVGGGAHAQSALAYNPATNRWRRLAPLPARRLGASALWTGKRLLLWGGQTGRDPDKLVDARNGLAYDPKTDRWSALPHAPLRVRGGSTAVWTGRALIVWGGGTTACRLNGPCHTRLFADGAVFTPATP